MNTGSCSDIFVSNNKGSIARIQMILLVYLYALYSLVSSYGIVGPAVPHWLFFIQKHIRGPVTGYCRKGRIFQTELGFSPTITHSTLSSAQSVPKCSILHCCKILLTVFNEKSCKKDCHKKPLKPEFLEHQPSYIIPWLWKSSKHSIFSFFIVVATKET